MTRVLLETSATRRPGHDRGTGRYVEALVQANMQLANQLQQIELPMGPGRTAEWRALPRRQLLLFRAGRDAVFHAPSPYYCALAPICPQVVSILDLIPLDVAAHRQTGFKAEFFHRRAARADAILTLSRHTASRIQARLGADPSRVVVAPLPPSPAFTPVGPRFESLPDRYVAAMADHRTPDPRKRLHWLEPLAQVLIGCNVPLVVVGPGTEDRYRPPAAIGLGRLPDGHLASVLRGAEFFIYPSAYEGQGMPPLESIACGTPVVAMNNSALPEVVGNAGELVPEANDDATSFERFLEACVDLLNSETRQARFRGQCSAQASEFTQNRFANAVASAYSLANS